MDDYLSQLIEALTEKAKQKLSDLTKIQTIIKKFKNEEQQYYLLVPRQILIFKVGCIGETEEHSVNFGEVGKFIKSCIFRKIKKYQKTYKRLQQKIMEHTITEEQVKKLEYCSHFVDAKIKDVTYTDSKIICEITKPIIFSKKIWSFLDNYFIYQIY